MPNHIKQKFAVTLWCIWRCRNEMIWEDKEVNPITAFSLAYQYFAEWCIECVSATIILMINITQLSRFVLGRNLKLSG